MKTKIFVVFTSLFSLLSFSQEKVDISVSYDLTYKLDSTSQETKTEHFLLFANKDKSQFLSTVMYVKDSLSAQPNSDKKMIALKYRTPNDYYIITEPQSNTVTHFQTLVNTNVYYSSNEKMNWKIEKETKLINNLKCKKATTQLFGRNWTAWFTEEYPFQLGPYKFYGLPGLILEVYDAKNYYHFVASQIKPKKDKFIDFNLVKNYKQISKDQFWKLDIKNKYEPLPIFNDLRFEDPTVLPKMKKNLEEKQKLENNPLELKH